MWKIIPLVFWSWDSTSQPVDNESRPKTTRPAILLYKSKEKEVKIVWIDINWTNNIPRLTWLDINFGIFYLIR